MKPRSIVIGGVDLPIIGIIPASQTKENQETYILLKDGVRFQLNRDIITVLEGVMRDR